MVKSTVTFSLTVLSFQDIMFSFQTSFLWIWNITSWPSTIQVLLSNLLYLTYFRHILNWILRLKLFSLFNSYNNKILLFSMISSLHLQCSLHGILKHLWIYLDYVSSKQLKYCILSAWDSLSQFLKENLNNSLPFWYSYLDRNWCHLTLLIKYLLLFQIHKLGY